MTRCRFIALAVALVARNARHCRRQAARPVRRSHGLPAERPAPRLGHRRPGRGGLRPSGSEDRGWQARGRSGGQGRQGRQVDGEAGRVSGRDGRRADDPRSGPKRAAKEKKAPNAVVFKDVAVGEVWVCSGQSNMEWSLDMIPQGRRAGGDQELGQPEPTRIHRPEVRRTDPAGRVQPQAAEGQAFRQRSCGYRATRTTPQCSRPSATTSAATCRRR